MSKYPLGRYRDRGVLCFEMVYKKVIQKPKVHFSPYPRNPRVGRLNRPRFGKTAARSVFPTPNQAARVAPYWSTATVGIQRPRAPLPSSVSSGPAGASVGNTVPLELGTP